MHALQERLVEWRRALHQMPELGNTLPKTAAYVRSALEGMGLSPRPLLDGNAFTVLIEGAEPGPCIALRADMDGLPIEEKTGLSFASTNGCMHACGHDAHAAMLLGAAALLKEKQAELKGSVKLLFQPGEEGPGGAEPMIAEGALLNPKVDASFGIHCGNISPEGEVGTINFKRGPMMAAVDHLTLVVKGEGTHGAYPHNGVDPVVLASELVLALQTLITREKDPIEPAVLSLCSIHGGAAHNIIPETVTIKGTIRTFDKALRDRLKVRIAELCKGLADSRRASIEVEHTYIYPALHNDSAFVDLAMASAKKVFGAQVRQMQFPVLGGEDMSFFLDQAPGCYAFLSNPRPINGKVYPHHNPYFDIDESYLLKGSQLLAQVAQDYLEQRA